MRTMKQEKTKMPEQNTIIPMRRKKLPEISSEHAGLLLDRGFYKWAEKEGKDDQGKLIAQHNKAAHQLHKKASDIKYSTLYKEAYKNWQKAHIANKENSKIWFGRLENRLYLGMGEASPLEAGITLHQTYGVPFIPGSAIKGVLHHYAVQIDLEEGIKEVLFGEKVSTENKNGSAGYLIYNDAWWVPEAKALAPEMITVHAPKYYSDKGKNFVHPDFESPNPNPQIAIQGSFMFSIEGEENWAEYAIKLLSRALKENGIGGKTASGYGYFSESECKTARNKFTHLKKTYSVELEKIKKANNEAEKVDIYKNSSRPKQIILDLENIFIDVNQLSELKIKNNYSDYVGKINKLITEAEGYSEQYSESEKEQIKALLSKIYEKIGWYVPSANKKQKTKQRNKKETRIKQLFNSQD